ncbi:uncharacterized protein ACBR49_018529 [Aulostomus maculatus]
MSSGEVCPFCGKTYKRLKSHLPHCKAAATSKTPSTGHDASQTPGQVISGLSKTKGRKSAAVTTGPLATRKVSAASLGLLPPEESVTSQPASTKKKKPKLSDQNKTTSLLSSANPPLISTPSSSPSKLKKTSPHASIEAAKSDQVSEGSTPQGRLSDLTLQSPETGHRRSSLNKNTVKGTVLPKGVSQKSPAKTKNTSPHLKVSENGAKEGHTEDFSGDELSWNTGSSGHQPKITLQDVRATLARSTKGRPRLLGLIEAAQDLNGKTSPVIAGDQKDGRLDKTETLGDQPTSTNSQQRVPTLVQTKQPEQASSVPPKWDDSLESKRTSAATLLSSPASQTSLQHRVSTHGGPMGGRQSCPLPPLPVRVERADGEVMKERQLGKENAAGDLAQQRLGQVRLRELHEWLASRTTTQPKDVVESIRRGWWWYNRKYISVMSRVGGVSMLLVGYFVVSYIWGYPRIKKERWRKYH